MNKLQKLKGKPRYQSKSPSQYKKCRCRITSSFYGWVCRRLSCTLQDELVNTILNLCMYSIMPQSCTWWKDNEDWAQSAYKQERHEKGHSGLEAIVSGHVINHEYSWFGASPDGVVHDPGCNDLNGLIEIKCLYNGRDSIPFQAASQRGLCCRFEKNKLVLREQNHYNYQVQG